MLDLEKAIYDPASVFKTPADVLAQNELTEKQKIEILQRWEYDILERQVAEEENMHISSDMAAKQVDIFDEILVALHKLHASQDVEHNSPTKLGSCDIIGSEKPVKN